MKIIEYRIFMPLTIEENLIGQLWSFAENSRLNTGGGEGVVIQANNMFQVPYDADKNVVFKNLPNYVEHKSNKDAQQSDAQSSATNGDESHKENHHHHKSKSLFKKSASKENFKKDAVKKSDTETSVSMATASAHAVAPTRSKSLDRTDSALSISNIQAQITHSDTTNVLADENSPHGDDNEKTKLNEDGTLKNGQYTHKLYFIASKLPWYVRKLLPKDSTIIHEKSWNMYPVVKTVLKNEYFKNSAHIELDTITRVCTNGLPDENVHNLSAEELEKREVVVIDITELFGEYKAEEDPTLFRSKTGRGPLTKNEWIAKQTPLICCYKLVHAEFKVFGFQARAENYVKNMYKTLFGIFHRQVFCWMDKWCDYDLAQVRKIEEDLAKLLVKKIEQGEVTKQALSVDAE